MARPGQGRRSARHRRPRATAKVGNAGAIRKECCPELPLHPPHRVRVPRTVSRRTPRRGPPGRSPSDRPRRTASRAWARRAPEAVRVGPASRPRRIPPHGHCSGSRVPRRSALGAVPLCTARPGPSTRSPLSRHPAPPGRRSGRAHLLGPGARHPPRPRHRRSRRIPFEPPARRSGPRRQASAAAHVGYPVAFRARRLFTQDPGDEVPRRTPFEPPGSTLQAPQAAVGGGRRLPGVFRAGR